MSKDIYRINFTFIKEELESIIYKLGFAFETSDYEHTIYDPPVQIKDNIDVILDFWFDKNKEISDVAVHNWKSAFGLRDEITEKYIVDILIGKFMKEFVEYKEKEYMSAKYHKEDWMIKSYENGDMIILTKRRRNNE